MAVTEEFDQAYAAEQLRRSRDPLRRRVKRLYLDNLLADVTGPTIDFGCGAGQLLQRLPAGSLGLELNPHLVAEHRRAGLNVVEYDAIAHDFSFASLPAASYRTLVISHVMEHFDDAAGVMRKIAASCAKLGIERIVVVVPGAKGYRSDKTHKTFIDEAYIERNGLRHVEPYRLAKLSYFPLGWRALGEYFTFHELKIVFQRG